MSTHVFDLQAKMTKALSNATRLQIIHLLRHHTLTVSQIQMMLAVSQSVVSQHLKSLKLAHIITSRRQGKEIYYEIADSRILMACDAIHSLVSGDPLPEAVEPIVVDSVCGMELTPSTAPHNTSYNGVVHYFCAKGCYDKFITDPGEYD